MAHYKHVMLQNGAEHRAFRELLVQEHVSSYLEIGSYYGGTLWQVAQVLPKGSRIVCVDMPTDALEPSQAQLEACCANLKRDGYDVHLFLTNSRDPATIAAVRALGPFDACFIDGDHTYEGIDADWENYGLLARMTAFHDISWKLSDTRGGDAPRFWHEGIKPYARRWQEIRLDDKPNENGIGVVWNND